jgi:hypothetical protein
VEEKTFQGTDAARRPTTGMRAALGTSSFIRTVTVGPGISPGLLTLHCVAAVQALAGS